MKNKFYSFLLVLIQFTCIGLLVLLEGSIFDSVVSITISAFGFLLGLYTLFNNPLSNFNIQPELKEGACLITTGPYGYIRHPMYTSVMLIMLGVVFSNIVLESIIIFDILMLVLYLKALKEENLWKEESSAYKEYALKTKMFIPFLF